MTAPEKRCETESKYLLGLGETTDISNVFIYLLSNASRWVTSCDFHYFCKGFKETSQ